MVREYAPAAELEESPVLGWLARLIEATRREGRLPRRQEIGPRRIGARAMPGVVMLDVGEAVPRYRLRLVGTSMVRLAGRDRTGQYLDELAGELGDAHGFYMRLADRLVAQRRPLLFTANLFHLGQPWLRYRCLACPCSDDGGRVDLIVGAVERLEP